MHTEEPTHVPTATGPIKVRPREVMHDWNICGCREGLRPAVLTKRQVQPWLYCPQVRRLTQQLWAEGHGGLADQLQIQGFITADTEQPPGRT